MLAHTLTIFKKEFNGYFRSRLGWFIMTIYVLLVIPAVFYATDFLSRAEETLPQFFLTQNNVLLLLIPAITMKLWTDERRQNTLELLLSQPVSLTAMVLGKFLAAWALCGLLLASVSPLWLLTARQTAVDNAGILINFGACWLMAGALCSICAAISALTSHAVTSFIVSLLVCFLLSSVNFDVFLQKAHVSNEVIMRSSQVFNFERHFQNIIAGQLTIANLFYYLSFIVLALWFNVAAVAYKRS